MSSERNQRGRCPARENTLVGEQFSPPGVLADQHIQIACSVPSCMHIAEENHLSDFQVHFLKEHAQCGKREVFLEFFNRAEEDDLVFHDLDHISTFKNSMLDEFCKLFGHLGFSSGALPSSTLLKGIIESLQNVFLRVPINVVGDRDVSIPGGMEGDQGAVCAGSPRSNQAGCGQVECSGALFPVLYGRGVDKNPECTGRS
ncbi:hypothetical protein PAPYR_12766 [Paratrimastix pyriformis]|uniref:Uncharacterized protein n=1 Tax=Paratrimastix pyriformis TaxID=342808 RepID=A0ABQ8U5Q5_9EUKA|nr:hypothetical protein PAPYR_12766 [Paratrimastix pyriformis]